MKKNIQSELIWNSLCFKDPETHITSEGMCFLSQYYLIEPALMTRAETNAFHAEPTLLQCLLKLNLFLVAAEKEYWHMLATENEKMNSDYSSFALYLQCDMLY